MVVAVVAAVNAILVRYLSGWCVPVLYPWTADINKDKCITYAYKALNLSEGSEAERVRLAWPNTFVTECSDLKFRSPRLKQRLRK